MINKKVPSFTLIEVTIAMLIASIAISITYTAYSIVSKLYADYITKQEKVSQVMFANRMLNMDFISAEKIIRTPNGFQVDSRQGKVRYFITKDFIVRDQFTLRADTFDISISSEGYYYNKEAVEVTGIIDEVDLSISSQDYLIPLKYHKEYSSQNLFE